MEIFAGWECLRYFDLDEHQIGREKTLAKIPKVGAQWKVIHDFKPTAYLSADNCHGVTEPFTIIVVQGNWMQPTLEYGVGFPVGRACVRLFAFGPGPVGEFMQLPPIGEWTRMELCQEYDENAEKYFCSLAIGGVEVIKEFAEDWNLDSDCIKDGDVYVMIGEEDVLIPGSIRRLVVLEKS